MLRNNKQEQLTIGAETARREEPVGVLHSGPDEGRRPHGAIHLTSAIRGRHAIPANDPLLSQRYMAPFDHRRRFFNQAFWSGTAAPR